MLFKTFLPVFLGVCFSQALGSGNSQESFIRIDYAPAHYYHPEVVYETYGEGIELPTGLAKGSMEETAVSFAMDKLRVGSDQVVHRAGFASDITEHVYLSQVHNGIPFVNAVANVAMKDGRILSFGSSFVKTEKISPSQPSVDRKVAIAVAEAALDCTYNYYPTSLQYLANSDGSSSLVHVIQVKNERTRKYYQAHVDAHTGKLISTFNYVTEATYYAVPFTKNSILDGQSLLVDPEDLKASEIGWHADTDKAYNITQGNNGLALSITLTDVHYTAESSRMTYNYSYDTSQEPDVGSNRDAAIVNAFYILNMAHDVTYRYGFTEKAFNYQMSNFNRGGQENDGIIVSVNDVTNENNAGFATAPDGESGVCSLYLFKHTKPFRPVAMDNPVMLHEFGHGLSTRLVGGGTATCLSGLESQGLGEGWSDAFANWVSQTSANTQDFMIGTYVLPPPYATYGFRNYPYSTDPEVNPRKYSDIRDMREEHDIGEVWANMLHNIYAELVAEHGYSTTAMTNPEGTSGNVVFMHLLVDSLSLIPCQPDFLAARDFFIQADANRYESIHRCLLWTVFASRGLGFNARQYVDNYELPTDC